VAEPVHEGVDIEVRLSGGKEMLEKLKAAQGYLASRRFLGMLNDAGQAYVLLAWKDAPKQSRLLARSLTHVVENAGTSAVRLRVGSWAKYAAHVEFGTGSSPRSAVNRRWMQWFTSGPGGKTIQEPSGMRGQKGYTSVFAKHVQHPGTKPQPFFLKHLPTIGGRLFAMILSDLKKIMSGGPAA
jgi:hypothetical protein